MKATIKRKVSGFIKENSLLEYGDTVIAGVSGGADSMCMLGILLALRDEFDLTVIVAHIDHGIRGSEAQADAEFVCSYCRERDIPFESIRADIPGIALKTGTTLEEAGRNFRYKFFTEMAGKYHAQKISVAHNSGDNAETVLFNIFRGSGIGGLKGILPKRSIKDSDGNTFLLIRPVLCLKRSEIEGFLEENGQEYRTDSTNLEESYSRNRIRKSILPMAEEYINSNVEGHIGALSRQAEEIEDYLFGMTDSEMKIVRFSESPLGKKCEINCEGLDSLHPVIGKRVLRRAFEMVSGRLKDVEETHILKIYELSGKQTGRKLSMPYGITARKEYENIILENADNPGIEEEIGISLEIKQRESLPPEIPRGSEEKWFDYDKIGSGPKVRTWESGDYIIIGSEKHRKSLSRFMIDSKIPSAKRHEIPLLADGDHILWVAGYRQDESCLIDGSTKNVLVAKIIRTEKVK